MGPLLQRALRSIFTNSAFEVSPTVPARSFTKTASNATSICRRCQSGASAISYPVPTARLGSNAFSRSTRRQFSISKYSFDRAKPSGPSESSPETSSSSPRNAPPTTSPSTSPRIEDTIARVPAEDLPSHRHGQRWSLSKRLSDSMDDLLPKLAIVTQKVNTYTGTDYSGIEALRKEIKDQEKLVRARRLAIDDAKHTLDAAHAQQGSSQKEVVALLERKHSWSAHDLERYMSLIRSEHVNDQAVREAKEAVQNAETALEEARSHLEKRERAQYHEEQIWSDTIRRNSTWVTFGLMGLNIVLLLASLVAVEPWRRSRLVREIKRALDAQQTAMGTKVVESAVAARATVPLEQVIIEPAGKLEHVEPEKAVLSPPPAVEAIKATILEEGVKSNFTNNATGPGAAPLTPDNVSPQSTINIPEAVRTSNKPGTWDKRLKAAVLDWTSDRSMSVRKIDYTTAMLQAATTGAIISGVLVSLLSSK